MQYEGYVVTPQPFVDTNLTRSQVIFADKETAIKIARSRQTGQHISKVNVTISNLFINNKSDPFVDIGDFRDVLSPHQFQGLAAGMQDELENTNEWERIGERHPDLSIMEVFHQFPKEFDQLPLWAEVAYNNTTVHDMLVMNGYDGALHAVHGPFPNQIAYHTFHPARINFIEKVEL